MGDDDQPDSFTVSRDKINQTSVDLLFTDTEVGLTFVSIAETTGGGETAERNVCNARKAYDSVQHFRLRYALTRAETTTLNSRLQELKFRLEALGQTF